MACGSPRLRLSRSVLRHYRARGQVSHTRFREVDQIKHTLRVEALRISEQHVGSKPQLLVRLPELTGRELAGWRAPAPCHGNVLVMLFDKLVRAPAS